MPSRWLSSRWLSSRWWRALQWALGVLVLGLALRTLARNWDQLRAQPLQWRVEPGWLLLSAVIVWLMYALLVVAWRSLLQAWGERIGGWAAARVWTLSSLGKYLPGKFWAVAGMAIMARRAGVAPWAATGSAVVLQVAAIGTGAVVAGFTGSAALESASPGARLTLQGLALASGIGLGLLLWPRLLRRVVRAAAPEAAIPARSHLGAILFGVAANLIAWVGYGAALWCLARGLLPSAGLSPTAAIAVFTASYLAGFLALLAPGGIGVRESVFILMLQGSLGIANATALALASRVLLTITELGAAVPFLAFPKGSERVAT